jgi:hypothetical protein
MDDDKIHANGRAQMTEYSLDGYCGLYCGACPMFLETKAGSDQNRCQGCKSGIGSGWCLTCNLKACARGKGLEFCYACADYPCENLEAFETSADYPYHREVYDYMKTIEKEGKAAWLEKMRVRWSCPACGKEASWWDLSCGNCGAELHGYTKP